MLSVSNHVPFPAQFSPQWSKDGPNCLPAVDVCCDMGVVKWCASCLNASDVLQSLPAQGTNLWQHPSEVGGTPLPSQAVRGARSTADVGQDRGNQTALHRFPKLRLNTGIRQARHRHPRDPKSGFDCTISHGSNLSPRAQRLL